MIKKTTQKKSGYALYTAIILTGILILVAYATANLSIQELALSVSGAESHIAFYNADTGLECAFYGDLKNGAISAFSTTTPGNIVCNSQSISTGSQTVDTVPTQTSVIGGAITSIFELDFSQGCAIVTVTKNSDMTTTIRSKGYNVCTGSRRLERGVQITY